MELTACQVNNVITIWEFTPDLILYLMQINHKHSAPNIQYCMCAQQQQAEFQAANYIMATGSQYNLRTVVS